MSERLSDALDRVGQVWREVSEVWDDSQRTRFETEYLGPILQAGRRYLDALADLDQVIRETEIR